VSVDGRTARRNRNRDAALDAAIELFGEGRTPPTPVEVAERSGVSLRSVYRYFADHDALAVAAVARYVERIDALFELDVAADAPLDERITRLVDARLRLYDAVAPVVRVVLQRSADLPVFASRLAARRAMLARQSAELFAPELARLGSGMGDVVDALTQFEAVEHLRVQRGLSRRRTRAALVEGLQRLLGP